MLRNTLIFIGLFGFTLFAQAADKVRTTKLPNGLSVHEYKLKNGLQVLIVPDHSAPVFTFQAWFRVGSADEKLDPKLKRTGLAHFFEHMMFRGTKKHKDGEFDYIISAAGAVGNNATTSYDRTNYFESLPKERLDLILGLEADRTVNLILNEQLFATERGAVLGELKMNKDKPESVAQKELWELAYDKSPYKYSIIGTEEELNGFTVADAQYFYKTYYAPNNATLILVGDLDIKNTLNLVEKHYGKLASQKIPELKPGEDDPQTAPRKKTLTHPLAQNEMVLSGYHIPGASHKDTAALEAIAAILAYGDSSILEQTLVAGGLASRTGAYTYGVKLPGLFMTYASVAPGKKAEDVEEMIRSSIKKIREGKLSEEDLARGKNQYLMQSYSDLRGIEAIGKFLGEGLVSSGDYLRQFKLLEEMKGLTVENLKTVAAQYLTNENSSTIVIVPEKK